MTVLVGEETRVPARGTAVPWVEQSSEWRVQGDGYRPQLADSRHSALDQNAAVETTNAARPAGAAAAARAGLRGAVRPDCAARGFAAGQSPGDDHTPSGEAVKAVKTAPRARPLASPPLPPFSSGLARNSGAAVGLPDPVPAPPSPFFRGRGDFGALCTRHYHRLREDARGMSGRRRLQRIDRVLDWAASAEGSIRSRRAGISNSHFPLLLRQQSTQSESSPVGIAFNAGAEPPAYAGADWPRKDNDGIAWSGQASAAVASRSSEGLPFSAKRLQAKDVPQCSKIVDKRRSCVRIGTLWNIVEGDMAHNYTAAAT
jgi:hypothetical protein